MNADIIKIPYTTQPGMMRWEGEVFNRHPDPSIIEQKKLELKKYSAKLYGFSFTSDHIKAVAQYTLGKELKSIVELALHFEEDIAIMHQGKLDAICFCFPSSWVPCERIGMSLTDIHKPVADGEKLVAASEKISHTMATQGPFRRYVWTLTNSGDLNQLPENKSNVVPQSIEDLYFRLETQTTAPIGDDKTSVFFVKVETVPLVKIKEDQILFDAILKSLNSMSQNILDYKNLNHIKSVLSGYGASGNT